MLGRSQDRIYSNDDLLSGNNDWQNIQDIVRITFKQLSLSLETQERTIQSLERQMSLKASRSEVQSLINHKIDTETFNSELNNLRNLVQSMRSETSEIFLNNSADIQKIFAEIDTKASKTEVKNQISELDYQKAMQTAEIKEIRKEFEGKLQIFKNQINIDNDYTREMNMIEFDKVLENNQAIIEEIAKNKSNTQEIHENLRMSIKDFEKNFEEITRIRMKSEEELKKTLGSALNRAREEFFDEISKISKKYNEVWKEIELINSNKADNSIFALIERKTDELLLIKNDLGYVLSAVKTKTPYQDFEREVKQSKENLELLKKEIIIKYDRKLNEIQEILDFKVEKTDFGMFLTKQEAINETLCSENTIGR